MRIILGLFLIPLLSFAKETVCLNMIVKDEKDVIGASLNSVKDHIDYWVIVDMGSSDGTQEIIQEHLKDIPGELLERPWRNFGENRTEALELARDKGDYLLFLDPDDRLEFVEGFEWGELTADSYSMWHGAKGFSLLKPQLLKSQSSSTAKWEGVTYEYLTCESCRTNETIEGVVYQKLPREVPPGVRQWKNIELFQEGLKAEPENTRYMFYLAECYRDVGEKLKALESYQARTRMGGWEEEIYWSHLQIAHLLKGLEFPPGVVAEAYLHAHRVRPHRAEAIYYLADHYNAQKDYGKAYKAMQFWASLEQPTQKDALFNEDWITDYGFLFQRSIASYYLGKYQESLDACDQILKKEKLPTWWRTQTETNRLYPLKELKILSLNDDSN